MIKLIEKLLSFALILLNKRAEGKERRLYEKTIEKREDVVVGNVKSINSRLQFLLWKAKRFKGRRSNADE